MRMFFLTTKNIMSFLMNQRRIFLILIISLVAASYSSLYLFSLYTYIHNNTLNQSNSTKTYIVEFNENEELYKRQQIINYILSMDNMPKIIEISLHNQKQSEQDNMLIVGISADYLYLNLLEGTKFSDEDIKEDKNLVIVSANINSSTSNKNIGSTLTIADEKYEIIGINSSYANEIYIPYSVYIKNNCNIATARIVFEKALNNQQSELLKLGTKSIMTSINIIDPPNQISEQYIYLLFVLSLICLLLFFCMINVASLFKFWIEENKYRLMIYKICGGNNKQIYFIVMMEALLLGLLSFAISIILFSLTIPYLKHFKVWHKIGFIQIVFILMMYLFSIYISIIKTGKKVAKINPVDKSLWG